MRYSWNDGYRARVDAQKAGERLDAIRKANADQLTPELVLRDARDAKSPLHAQFEWDNQKAAMEWRLYEARALIRSLRVILDDAGGPRRFYVHVDGPETSGYVTITQMLAHPEMRAQVLQDATRALGSWRERYRELEELGAVFKVADRVVKKLDKGVTSRRIAHPSSRSFTSGPTDDKRPIPP